MTLMSLGPEDMRQLADQGDADIQSIGLAEQRMLDDWERQIAYCHKYRDLLSKKDRQFVDELTGRQPTAGRIRYLNAVTAAIRRDPRSSGG
jgi:hypothetical protein